jgi:hypothetical protein
MKRAGRVEMVVRHPERAARAPHLSNRAPAIRLATRRGVVVQDSKAGLADQCGKSTARKTLCRQVGLQNVKACADDDHGIVEAIYKALKVTPSFAEI